MLGLNLPDDVDALSRMAPSKILEEVSKYYPLIRAARISHDVAEAIISEAAWHFIVGIREDRIRKSALGYLNAIVRNAILEYKRHSVSGIAKHTVDLDGDMSHENYHRKPYQESEYTLLFEDVLQVLTPRQREIVLLLMSGYSQVDIAYELDLKPSTINYHVKALKQLLVLELGLTANKSRSNRQKAKPTNGKDLRANSSDVMELGSPSDL